MRDAPPLDKLHEYERPKRILEWQLLVGIAAHLAHEMRLPMYNSEEHEADPLMHPLTRTHKHRTTHADTYAHRRHAHANTNANRARAHGSPSCDQQRAAHGSECCNVA